MNRLKFIFILLFSINFSLIRSMEDLDFKIIAPKNLTDFAEVQVRSLAKFLAQSLEEEDYTAAAHHIVELRDFFGVAIILNFKKLGEGVKGSIMAEMKKISKTPLYIISVGDKNDTKVTIPETKIAEESKPTEISRSEEAKASKPNSKRDKYKLKQKYKKFAESLHKATAEGNLELMQYLIKKGISHNAIFNKRTPLQTAIHIGNSGSVDLLLNFPEVDLFVLTPAGHSLLHLAAASKKRESLPVLALLLDKAQKMLNEKFPQFLELRTKKGWTALHVAAAHGNYELVSLLLHYKCDINSRTLKPVVDSDDGGKTALELAKKYDYKEVVSLLEEFIQQKCN